MAMSIPHKTKEQTMLKPINAEKQQLGCGIALYKKLFGYKDKTLLARYLC
jgi:hypothetical protein